jgi:hypothetical protein
MKKEGSNVLRLVSHMLAAVFNSRTAFHREWNRCEGLIPPQESLEGRWIGEWVSDLSGHHGGLKCVLAPSGPGSVRAYFHASFSGLFTVGYVTELQTEQTAAATLLKGEEDLGSLAGGVYRCDGEVTGENFNCRYSCKYDRGVFRMRRQK